MKTIIKAVLAIMLAMAGGRGLCADFSDLQTFKGSEVKVSSDKFSVPHVAAVHPGQDKQTGDRGKTETYLSDRYYTRSEANEKMMAKEESLRSQGMSILSKEVFSVEVSNMFGQITMWKCRIVYYDPNGIQVETYLSDRYYTRSEANEKMMAKEESLRSQGMSILSKEVFSVEVSNMFGQITMWKCRIIYCSKN